MMHYPTFRIQIILIMLFFVLVLFPGCSPKEEAKKGEEEKVAQVEQAEAEPEVEMKTIDSGVLCPQTRGTESAPEAYASMTNPLPSTGENIEAGKMLFHHDAKPVSCETCHGFKGNGMGVIFQRMKPYPRDFTCFQHMKDITDGQLFWIIQTGSHGTRMKAFEKLEEEQIRQLVHYLRNFSD